MIIDSTRITGWLSRIRMSLIAGSCAFIMLLWLAGFAAAAQSEGGGARMQDGGEQESQDEGDRDTNEEDDAEGESADDDGDSGGGAGEIDVDHRNPRRIRRERGEQSPPRMVAGGISIGGEDTLKHYDRLTPFIGRFTVDGRTWRFPEAEPREFTGEFTNAWALDGWYMQSEIRLDFRRDRPYIMLGMTCYDSDSDRYESDFYNSSGDNRTFRYGAFENDEGGPLTMLSRGRDASPDEEPDSKIVWTAIGDDRFTYTGWTFNPEKDEWWKSYELICTRSDGRSEPDE